MIPWHELFGFAVLWLVGYLCYLMGRRFEEDRWVRMLVGHAKELERIREDHRDEVESLPR